MIREKSRKKLFDLGIVVPCLCLLFSIFMFSSKAEAGTTYAKEAEPNDMQEQAQTIQENKSTPDGYYNSVLDGTYRMEGTTSTTDEDWFKVFLTKGLKYFTCGDKPFDYIVEDQAGNIVTQGAYNAVERVFTFVIPTDGTYYVRIKGISVEETNYHFLIGDPIWRSGSVKVPCNPTTINMTGGSKIGYFDAANLNIPKDAVVSSLSFYDIRTTAVKSIEMTNGKTGNNINMRQYVWSADGLETRHLPAAVTWRATFGYSTKTSFTPNLNIYYLYPLYQ